MLFTQKKFSFIKWLFSLRLCSDIEIDCQKNGKTRESSRRRGTSHSTARTIFPHTPSPLATFPFDESLLRWCSFVCLNKKARDAFMDRNRDRWRDAMCLIGNKNRNKLDETMCECVCECVCNKRKWICVVLLRHEVTKSRFILKENTYIVFIVCGLNNVFSWIETF